MADAPYKTIKVAIPESTFDALHELLDRIEDGGSDGDHGLLDLPKLAAMLLEDAALVQRRPGSWEGSNMARVLAAHGYEP